MIEIVPTIVPESFEHIFKTVRAYPFASTIHVDFADGVFAPNTTWLPQKAEDFSPEGITLEAHLMVQEPLPIGDHLARGGFSRIIGHVESTGTDTKTILEAWRSAGAKEVGLALLFATPLESIDPYIGMCDVVQMMSIASIGVQGIPYEPEAPSRIAALHKKHPDLLIADDGGVSEKNIADLARAGARRFCVGSALAKSVDPESTYKVLMTLAESGIQ